MNDLSNKNVKNKIGYHREVDLDITIRGRGGSVFLRKNIVFQNHLLEEKSTRYKNILMYRLLNTITKVVSLIQQYFSYILDITFIGEGNQSTQRKLQAPLQDMQT
jgi:hypothetical protein